MREPANLPGNRFVTRAELVASLDDAGTGGGSLAGYGVR